MGFVLKNEPLSNPSPMNTHPTGEEYLPPLQQGELTGLLYLGAIILFVPQLNQL